MRFNPKDDERQLAKEIILEIVRASPRGRFEGKGRLYKGFLIAHLFHFRDNNRILSNWPIVHMPQGHGIDQGDALLEELIEEGAIAATRGHNGPFPEFQYRVLSRRKSALSPEARKAVRKTILFIRGKSLKELSDLIHEKSRSYKNGTSGRELNIYIDLIDDEEFAEKRSKLKAISDSVDAVFGIE